MLEALRRVFGGKPKPIVVEEYRIEPFDVEGGLTKLRIVLHDFDGSVFTFEMHPGYAHHFSDDLLRFAARAMAPKPPDHAVAIAHAPKSGAV